MKRMIAVALTLIIIVLVIPAALVGFGKESTEHADASFGLALIEKTSQVEEAKVGSETVKAEETKMEIAVFRSKAETVEVVPLKEYVIGVVASEMPTDYELEALKAQSLAAQTYVLSQQLKEKGDRNVPQDALVTDTVLHQVYQSKEELEEKWGDSFPERYSKVEEAVEATEGQVITYKDQPITAAFFSTSNGFTENSEDYWAHEIPYLKSVKSPWDTGSPRYSKEVSMPISEFEATLGVTLSGDGSIGTISSRTSGGRVETVVIGDKTFSGREIREALELDSSDFSWHLSNNMVVIQTKGWGHGVGMSQFGANGMALEGQSYQDIIAHYYSGVEIESMETYKK
ncbi:stage II sporulation protein D [Alkalihalobacillus xiaoxiensis]|uniref:Stage II sporulation protein D n=1 Tax=Shouchella xiaoxiensis TaxID=766895 RepID=A0ABS2SVN7_9BACI|nr:stage II sporulation protein D [Shouchella xiaoxiensis]MBM7839549.1 stage II sporulation protein D [Shouchella xiaoxiensis]